MKTLYRTTLIALALVALTCHAAITVVQVGSVGQFNGASLTAQSVLTAVTSGNTIIDCVNHVDFGSTTPTLTVSDGSSHTNDESITQSGQTFSGVFRLSSASAGTHTVVATASSGTTGNSFGSVVSIEVAGLAASPVDQIAVGHANGTAPSVTSAALSQANELLVACYQANGSPTGITWPPTGGPGTFTSINNSIASSDSAAAQQIQTSGTSAVTASAGTTASVLWVMPLVTYKAAVAAGSGGGGMMMRGMGKNVRKQDYLLAATR